MAFPPSASPPASPLVYSPTGAAFTPFVSQPSSDRSPVQQLFTSAVASSHSSSSSGVNLLRRTVSFDSSAPQLNLKVISYEEFQWEDPITIEQMRTALREDGIVGIRGIPGYRELVEQYLEAARSFAALSVEEKQHYAPNRAIGEWLGYEIGKEKFKGLDGVFVPDMAKASYYAIVQDETGNNQGAKNVWPSNERCALQKSYLAIGKKMFDMAKMVLQHVGYIPKESGISLEKLYGVGRMLHYQPNPDNTNSLWCGDHFDHGLFTALLPDVYFKKGERLEEKPKEAGLFVQKADEQWYKVISDDPDVLYFQTGEFAQLATNGKMQATKHHVRKPNDLEIEWFTMAVFVSPENNAVIQSTDPLAKDTRYCASLNEGDLVEEGKCPFLRWHLNSIDRYENKEEVK